ncbi:MAG TPA: ABC transporter permease [Vicinamibacterales bacterium]|nr:ABC transporter permease [Vicinamibacterales bacterium]
MGAVLITLRVALVSLSRNGLRSTLTVLSIAIGMAAIVCTAALGGAGVDQVRQQMDALGDNFVWIRAGSVRPQGGASTGFGGAQTMTPDDATAIEQLVPGIESCSPVVQGRQQIVTAGRNWNTRYQGVVPSFFAIRNRVTSSGQLFTDYDQRQAERVVVLGASAAEQLFDQDDPIGARVRINGFPFTVIGVLARKGVGTGGLDRDDVAFIPLATVERNIDGRDRVSDIMCAVRRPDQTSAAEAAIADLLRERHRLDEEEPDDFRIQRPVDILNMRAESAQTLSRLLTGIGAVSLVIGGVGILNIMLVSVTERRREIGIRLAIGARTRDIQRQFLIEAATLGLAGAGAGIALGWLAAWAFSAVFDWPIFLSAAVALWAAAAALGASIVFGYFPAHLASNLDPLEVMRTET